MSSSRSNVSVASTSSHGSDATGSIPTHALAKRNRLGAKFDFKSRDWRIEWEDAGEAPRIPFKDGRPRRQKTSWRRKRQPDSEE